ISEQQLNILQNNRAFQLWRATQSEQKEDRMKNYNKKLSLELIDLCNSKKFNCEKNKIILMSYPNHNTDGFLIDRLTATGIDLIDNLEPFQTTIQSSGWSAIFKDYIGYSTGHLNETGKGKFVEKIISHLKDRSLIKKEKTPSMNSDKVR
ncbi:MAG: hypothetical protein KDD61_05045, partial [Bdellovibrionales bacterium]|nr:hypothetical protein [Bdellovibrionales bacterium]